MKYEEFRNAIKEIYAEKFPNSAVRIRECNGLERKVIIINLQLANTQDECVCGYWLNDMFDISFSIELPKNFNWFSDDLPDTLVLECASNIIKIKPDNRYCYYSTEKVPFRKTTGDTAKILNVLKKYVYALYMTVKEEIIRTQIHPNFEELVNKKIV